jgi:hypothetical protein
VNTTYFIATAALLSLAAPPSISATPQRITVPAHLEYCVVSRPVSASKYELPEVREALFQQLDKQIEEAALAADLPSIGVTFVDAITPGNDLHEDGAGASAPEKTYVVRECVIVPALGNPPLPASGVRQIAGKTLTATICNSTAIEACKRDLEKSIRQENGSPADATRPIIWRTRPALLTDDSVDNFVTSMSDAKLRKLKDGAQSATVQDNLVILSAELGVAGN